MPAVATAAAHQCSLYFFLRYSSAPTPSCISFEGVKNFKWHRRQTARAAIFPRYFRIENPVSFATAVARPNPDPWECSPLNGQQNRTELSTRLGFYVARRRCAVAKIPLKGSGFLTPSPGLGTFVH